MEKESLLYNKVVYVAIPKRLFEDDITKRALQYIKTLKPLATIDPRGMFSSNDEWLKAFPRYLKPCEAMVIVTDDGWIGLGCWREMEIFEDRKLPIFYYVDSDNGHQRLSSIAQAQIIDLNNWTNYARIYYA